MTLSRAPGNPDAIDMLSFGYLCLKLANTHAGERAMRPGQSPEQTKSFTYVCVCIPEIYTRTCVHLFHASMCPCVYVCVYVYM